MPARLPPPRQIEAQVTKDISRLVDYFNCDGDGIPREELEACSQELRRILRRVLVLVATIDFQIVPGTVLAIQQLYSSDSCRAAATPLHSVLPTGGSRRSPPLCSTHTLHDVRLRCVCVREVSRLPWPRHKALPGGGRVRQTCANCLLPGTTLSLVEMSSAAGSMIVLG